MIKMDIKKEDCNLSFTLYKKESQGLFDIGGNDICIMKEIKNNEWCDLHCFYL